MDDVSLLLKELVEERHRLWNIREQYRVAVHRSIGLVEEDRINLRLGIRECDRKIKSILEYEETIKRWTNV